MLLLPVSIPCSCYLFLFPAPVTCFYSLILSSFLLLTLLLSCFLLSIHCHCLYPFISCSVPIIPFFYPASCLQLSFSYPVSCSYFTIQSPALIFLFSLLLSFSYPVSSSYFPIQSPALIFLSSLLLLFSYPVSCSRFCSFIVSLLSPSDAS